MASLANLLTSKKGLLQQSNKSDYSFEPLITGYFVAYIKWPKVFDYILTNQTEESYKQIVNNTKQLAKETLIKNIISIDLPNHAIQTEPLQFGRMFRVMIPTNPDVTQTINISYYETKDSLLLDLFDLWSNVIFNTTQHIPLIDLSESKQSFQSLIKSSLYVIILDPTFINKDVKDFVYAFKFLGVMPTNVQYSSFNTNIENNDLMKTSITLSFDMMISCGPFSDVSIKYIDELQEQVQNIIDGDKTEIDKYENDIKELVDKIKYWHEGS